jgi:hypothetical protein
MSIRGKDITIFAGLSVEEANKFLLGLADKYDKVEGGYVCKTCGNEIQQTTLFISIHNKGWKGCVGSGKVQNVNYPYCPTCDGEPSVVRACIHV